MDVGSAEKIQFGSSLAFDSVFLGESRSQMTPCAHSPVLFLWVRSHLEIGRRLDAFAWYLALHEYSRPRRTEDDEEPELGPDGDLVSAMISTAIIPKLCKIIEKGGFDPYSSKNVRRLIDVVEEIEVSVPKTELKFEVRALHVYAFRRLTSRCN